ncbi:MAG: leucine-rich repeat domain-containing protein [Spartobacteria bacterium]|nr:leucine-rich repeat domain-containing protein [Spartobacteria bacterium]
MSGGTPMRKLGRWIGAGLAWAATAVAGDFTWTIVGDGAMLANYAGAGSDLAIPAEVDGRPVIAIGSEAFANCAGLHSVSIPDGLVRIDSKAFAYCTGLVRVELGAGVAEIGQWAFRGCRQLAEIAVAADNPFYRNANGALVDRRTATLVLVPPRMSGSFTVSDGLAAIGNEAFAGCALLTNVVLPDGLANIGAWAFDSSGLKSIYLPDSVTEIGEGAFSGCAALGAVEGGGGLVEIGRRAFERSGLTTYAMSNGVERLGKWAFYGCRRLARVRLSERLERIEERTFFDCAALASIQIPRRVNFIGEWAFGECPALAAVYFGGMPPLVDPEAFANSPSVVNYYLAGIAGWGSSLGGRPAQPGRPVVEMNAPAARPAAVETSTKPRSGAAMARDAGFF